MSSRSRFGSWTSSIENALYNPRLPKMCNTDGEPLVLTVLRFTLRCTPASAFERLRSLAHEPDASLLLSDAVLDETGALQSVSVPWIKKGNRLHRDWKNTSLGRIKISGDRLEVAVNSRPRASRIRREIETRLGPHAEAGRAHRRRTRASRGAARRLRMGERTIAERFFTRRLRLAAHAGAAGRVSGELRCQVRRGRVCIAALVEAAATV